MFTGFELYSRWVPLRTHVFESPVNELNLVMYRRTDIQCQLKLRPFKQNQYSALH